MQTFAQAWLVLQLSGSSFLLGFDSFLGSIPIVLFSLVGGVFADRTERQKILLGSQYIQMACAFLLAILFATGVIHIWHILVLSFITGTAQSFGGPAYQALIPSLVKAEDLPNAIALNSIQFNVARVLGPTLGGVALLLGGVPAFLPQRHLVRRSDHFADDHPPPLRAHEEPRDGPVQHERRLSFHPKAGNHGSAHRARVPDDFAGFSPGWCSCRFSPATFSTGGRISTPFFWFAPGIGSICGALIVAGMGKYKHQGRAALLFLLVLGLLIASFALSRWLILSCVLIFFRAER